MLLMARAPENEQLNALARRMGVEATPWPTVSEAEEDCILCGLCDAVCDQVLGKSAIGFSGRGMTRAVTPPFREPSEACIACGACAAVCPVGTIQIEIDEDAGEVEISPFGMRAKLLECEQCGARVVSVPVAAEVLGNTKIDCDKFRQLVRLCPKCRRKSTARTASEALAGGGETRWSSRPLSACLEP